MASGAWKSLSRPEGREEKFLVAVIKVLEGCRRLLPGSILIILEGTRRREQDLWIGEEGFTAPESLLRTNNLEALSIIAYQRPTVSSVARWSYISRPTQYKIHYYCMLKKREKKKDAHEFAVESIRSTNRQPLTLKFPNRRKIGKSFLPKAQEELQSATRNY